MLPLMAVVAGAAVAAGGSGVSLLAVLIAVAVAHGGFVAVAAAAAFAGQDVSGHQGVVDHLQQRKRTAVHRF
jgi:hypothetical protein